MAIETLGETFAQGWSVTVRCAHGREMAAPENQAAAACALPSRYRDAGVDTRAGIPFVAARKPEAAALAYAAADWLMAGQLEKSGAFLETLTAQVTVEWTAAPDATEYAPVPEIPDAMVMVDNRGHITLVNAQAERLFQYSREEMIGQRIEMMIPERYRNQHPRHRTGFFGEPRFRPMGVGLELFGLRKDGREIPVEISLSPLHTDDGTVVTAAIRDVTERKLNEAQIKKLQ
jgi:PAS domain S-box-containing protein